ncbi:hypothetical protein ACIP4S_13250 [Streptomyces chartreusis]|uniref:hypothetical protein n=1 Tax=Streptomyces chartreusis TaxID=1969 RepID=UPI00380516E4
MTQLSLAAVIVALVAFAATLFGLPDRWHFGVQSFAALMGSADAAYHENKLWAGLLLATAGACAAAAALLALRDAHRRHAGGG